MKLFVDDVRHAPHFGWIVVRTIDDAKRYLMRDDIEEVSLDHDMGACDKCLAGCCKWCGLEFVRGRYCEDQGYKSTCQQSDWTGVMPHCRHVGTGYDLVLWMVTNDRVPRTTRVHSMNPDGRKRMVAALQEYINKKNSE